MLYDFEVTKVDGTKQSLRAYEGKVLLIVNTATECGFTPQYKGLEELYQKYKSRDFEILDFPCNQFLQQAPGTNEEIASFCQTKYHTTFTTFAKIDVNGPNAAPLYAYLTEARPQEKPDPGMPAFRKKLEELGQTAEGEDITWNFTKFLVDRKGIVVERFAPTCPPERLEIEIEELL